MLPRLRFRATFSQSFFNRRLCFKSLNKWGGAVAVRAIVGTLGKNAFNTDRSLKCFLNLSPLKKKKKPWAPNLKVQTCAMIHAKNTFCLAVRIFIIWLAPRAGKMNQIARCDWPPERVRWSNLAHRGLLAVTRKKNFPESRIINPLLTNFLRSRWLDIDLVLVLRVYGPRLRLGP